MVPGGFALAIAVGISGNVAAASASPKLKLPPLCGGGYGAAVQITTSSGGCNGSSNVSGSTALALSHESLTRCYAIAPGVDSTITAAYPPVQLRSRRTAHDTYTSSPISQIGKGSRFSSLTILQNIAGNSTKDLSYTSYAIGYTFGHNDVGFDSAGLFAGVFSQTFPNATLLRTGAAYYSGIVDCYVGSARRSGSGDLLTNSFPWEIATGLYLCAEYRKSCAEIGLICDL